MTGDLSLIKSELQARCVEVCRALLPHGRVEGRLYVASDPVQGDYDKKPALKVRLSGNVGGWAAFRGGAEGARHDLLGLIEYVLGGDCGQALEWARDFLGLRQMSREDREKMRARVEGRRKQEEKRQEAAKAWKVRRAREMFEGQEAVSGEAPRTGNGKSGVDVLEREAVKVQDYLANRRVPLADVATLAGENFRFYERSEYWMGAEYEEREDGRRVKVQAGRCYPALHAAVRNEGGEVVGVHVTFLDEVLPAKAPVEKPKLMFGSIAGGVVEIATGMVGATRDGERGTREQGNKRYGGEGASPNREIGMVGRPFWQEERPNYLILCEGIETGLALAIAAPEARVWAALSLVNMGNAPVGCKCVAAVILARDVNAGNRGAQKQLASVVEKLELVGKPIQIMQSHVGDDFNDLMKGEVA